MKVLNNTKKMIYIALGLLCTGLGILGAFLPLMPTTIFLLLAAYFFSRSSDRFLQWLLNNKICGKYIRNYREHRGMTKKDKVLALSMMWIVIVISCTVIDGKWPLKAIFIITILCVSIYILRLKTLNDFSK